MRQHRPGEPRRDDAAELRRPPERGPAADVLGLQRSAGNRAVSALLARQPAPADPDVVPAKEQRGATATFGLGDEIVIPVDSIMWELDRNHVVVSFEGDNPAVPTLWLAAAEGRSFATGFVSTLAVMSRMTGVHLTAVQAGSSGGEDPAGIATVTAEYDAVEHEPVR